MKRLAIDHIGGMRYFAVAAALALAGCATKPIEQMSYSEMRELSIAIDKRCTDQGFGPNHPERDNCVKQEISREQSTRHANAQRRNNRVRVSAYCQNFGGNVVCF